MAGRSLAFAHAKVKDSFLDVLKMNVKIWSLFQFININYYRVLFMCGLSLLWNIYVAIKRR
uniref:Integral membrane protein n=1 Tax=Macrostomum lignano TaxID=282301 RepID=A0A1I8FN60_9PLAT